MTEEVKEGRVYRVCVDCKTVLTDITFNKGINSLWGTLKTKAKNNPDHPVYAVAPGQIVTIDIIAKTDANNRKQLAAYLKSMGEVKEHKVLETEVVEGAKMVCPKCQKKYARAGALKNHIEKCRLMRMDAPTEGKS